MHAVSIGGHGRDEPLGSLQSRVLSSRLLSSATIRLRSELPAVRRVAARVEYYPDMMLSVHDMWRPLRRRAGQTAEVHIGLNASQDVPYSEGAMRDLLEQYPDIVVHFLNNIPETNRRCRSDLMPKTKHPRIQYHAYIEPGETMRVVAALDVMVTHKLHLGVTALSYGIPFVSYGGSAKVRAFLGELGLSHCDHGGAVTSTAIEDLVPAALAHVGTGPRLDPRVRDAKLASRGHLDALVRVLSGIASRDEVWIEECCARDRSAAIASGSWESAKDR
jgi:hypothetical protein